MNIYIKEVKNGNIYHEGFKDMTKNNKLKFSNKKKINVIYAPNGVGKSSFCKILKEGPNKDLKLDVYKDGTKLNIGEHGDFHVIFDQLDRNIIEGETGDYILGDNIRRETYLRNNINTIMNSCFESINLKLKELGISKKSHEGVSPLILSDEKIINYSQEIVVTGKNKNGRILDKLKVYDYVNNKKRHDIPTDQEENIMEFIKLLEDKKTGTLLSILFGLKDKDTKSISNIEVVEETTYAIDVLERFRYKEDECIVCDGELDYINKLNEKKDIKKNVTEKLDKETKKLLEKIDNLIPLNDFFNIKQIIYETYRTGSRSSLNKLIDNLETYRRYFNNMVENIFVDEIKGNKELEKNINSLNKLLTEEIEVEDEDEIYIENIIKDHMNKKLEIIRENDKIKIKLEGDNLLNKDRESLKLSTGEQNFISLAFEILKASKSEKEFIVIDDPISSFDSIYKNKIVYTLVHTLSQKNTIIFTHNLDLVKLLEAQRNGYFNLYVLNNVEGGNNGFIEIDYKEKDILLYLDKFLELFKDPKNSLFNSIVPKGNLSLLDMQKIFLVSLLPFMRGYSILLRNYEEEDCKVYNDISCLMHGTIKKGEKIKKINIAEIYEKVFTVTLDIDSKNKDLFEISYEDILNMGDKLGICKDLMFSKVVDISDYKLLSLGLSHSFTYLLLRIKVENELQDIFNLEVGKDMQLGEVIDKALKVNKQNEELKPLIKEWRMFFMSRKTLLNDFNHFETNLNIFQPALDISNEYLEKEKQEIYFKLKEIREKIEEK